MADDDTLHTNPSHEGAQRLSFDPPNRGHAIASPATIRIPLPLDWLDRDAAKVLRRLKKSGHTAYLVGGCVRDLMLGRYPKDFDIATSALPREVKRVFSNCRLVGRRFRLAHVRFHDNLIEVATFRRSPSPGTIPEADAGGTEGEEARKDASGPEEKGERASGAYRGDLLILSDNVFGTEEQDARRRDFTVNGLFFDVANEELRDWVGGTQDIRDRVIRTIGEPEIRFREDPVRMLRAIRFAAALGFTIEPVTWAAMRASAPDILRSARPRVLEELFRMLRGGAAARCVYLLSAAGLLPFLLPELGAGPVNDEHVDKAIPTLVGEGLPASPALSPAESATGSWAASVGVPHPVLRILQAIDVCTGNGIALANHMLLALLTLAKSASLNEGDDAKRDHPHLDLIALNEILAELTQSRLRLSRRERERARAALMGLVRITSRAERGLSLAILSKKSYYPDALTLFAISAWARGRGMETVPSLIRRSRLNQETLQILDLMTRCGERCEDHAEASAHAPTEGRRSRRRGRRRGRRRARGGEPSSTDTLPSGARIPLSSPMDSDAHAINAE